MLPNSPLSNYKPIFYMPLRRIIFENGSHFFIDNFHFDLEN